MPNTTAVVRTPQVETTFRRTIRDKNDKVVETFLFEPDIPQELHQDQLEMLANDIGSALVLTKQILRTKQKSTAPDEFMIKPDWEATQEFAANHAEKVIAQAEKSGVAPYLSEFQAKAYEKLKSIGFDAPTDEVEVESEEPPKEVEPEEELPVDEVPEPAIVLTSQAKLAEFFGVTEKVVKEWKGLGLEKPEDGYDTNDVYEWLEAESLLGENVQGAFELAMDMNLNVFNRDNEFFVHAPSGECLNIDVTLSEGDVNSFIEGLMAE